MKTASRTPSLTRLATLGLCSVAALGLLAPRGVQAATYTWDAGGGATTTWSTGTNWNPDGAPTFAAGDTFDLSTLNIAASTTSTMDTANTLGTIKIGDTDNTHIWTLSGVGILTLDGNGSAASINQVSTSKGDTISITTVKLNSDLGLTNSSANALTISSGITSNTSGTKTITNSGTGTGGVALNGIIGNGSGTVAVTQNSATSALTLGGANTFTGGVTISSGSVILNSVAGAGTGTITVNGGTLSAQTGGTGLAAYANAMTWNGDFSLATPSKSNTFSGNVTLAAPLTVTVVNNASNTATLSGSIISTNGIFDVTKAGTGTLIYSQAIALTANQISTVNAGILRLSGIISGSGFGVSNFGAGTLELSGNNTYTGLTNAAGSGVLTLSGNNTGSGGVTATSGTLNINSAGALGTGTLTIGSGATINSTVATVNANNNAQSWNGNFTFTGTNTLNLGTGTVTLAAPLTATITASTLTVGGVITTSGGTNNSIFDVTKAGAGTLLYTPNIILASAQTANVTAGTLALSGVVSGGFGLTVTGGGALSFTGATANASSSAITASGGGVLTFDSSTTGVTGATRAASVTLKGGGLNVLGNSTVNSVDTITGALTTDIPTTVSAASANVVTLTPNSATNTQLVAGSLVHTANTAVFFRGTNLGANTIASATANTSNISFTTAPTAQLVGGGGSAGSKNISIIPWAIGDTSATGSGSSFVTYDANGIRPLASGEYDTALPAGASTNNVSLSIPSTTTVTVNGATTVNSLLLTGSPVGSVVTLAGTGALTITSGALFINYGTPSGATIISKPLDFGSAQGFIGTNGVTSDSKGVFITGGISGSGGLVLYNSSAMVVGTSGVTLSTVASTYTGDTYIIGGASIGIDGAIPNGARTGDLYVYGRLSNNQGNGASFTINGLNGTGTIGWDHSGNTRKFVLGDNTSDASFSGSLIGGSALAELRKVGTNTQVLSSTANTYGGVTNVQNGTLSAVTLNSVTGGSATSSLGNPTTLANGTIGLGSTTTTGTLKVVGTGETTDRVVNLVGTTGGGTLDQSGTGLLKFTSDFTATGGGSKTLTVQGSTAGTGEISGTIVNNSPTNTTTLVKAGTGAWTLSGTNSYKGTTTVSAGSLIAGASSLATSVTNNSSVTANNTTDIITLAGNTLVDGDNVVFSAATIPTGLTTGTVYFVVNSSGNTFQVSTTLGGSAVNFTANGTTVVASQYLPGAFGTGNSAIVLGDAATTTNNSSPALLTGGALTIGRAVTVANQATTGAYTIGGNTANTSAFTGLVTTNQNLTVSQTTGGTLNITGGITGASAGTKTVRFNNVGAVSIGSVGISDGATGNLALTQSGAGTTTLNAANTYTGITTVSAGTLALGAADRIADTSNLVMSGGTFATGGFNETLGTLTLSANSTIDLGSGTSALVFADSSGTTWGTSISLSFVNFTAGVDTIRVGTTSGGLSPTQLALITINGNAATIDGSGFLASAIPEPSTYALFAGAGLLLFALGYRLRARRALNA